MSEHPTSAQVRGQGESLAGGRIIDVGRSLPLPYDPCRPFCELAPEDFPEGVEAAERDGRHILINVTKASASDRLAVFASRVARSRRMANYLLSLPEDLAQYRGDRQIECGSWLLFREFFQVEGRPVKLARGAFCHQHLLCEFCAARRATRTLGKVIPLLVALLRSETRLRPYLATFTGRNQETLLGSFEHVQGAISRMLAQRRKANSKRSTNGPSPFQAFEGGIFSGEVKRGRNSGLWHYHSHAIVLIDQSVSIPSGLFHRVERWPGDDDGRACGWLAEAWSNLLGYSANIDLRPLRCLDFIEQGYPQFVVESVMAKDLMEVFKYALKFADLSHEDRWAAAKQLSGKRLMGRFDKCRGMKEEDELTDDLAGLEDEPYVETVYNFWRGEYRLAGEPERYGEFDAWNEGTAGGAA